MTTLNDAIAANEVLLLAHHGLKTIIRTSWGLGAQNMAARHDGF
jgi:hypothetical protein